MISVETVKEEIEKFNSDCRDEVTTFIKLGNISVDSDNQVTLENDEGAFTFTNHARSQLFSTLGMPLRYFRKCPESMTQEHLNYWLHRNSNVTKTVRFKGSNVRAILSDQFRDWLDNKYVVSIIEQVIPDLDIDSFRLDDTGMMVRTTDRNMIPLGNDKLKLGISFTNSEIGLHSFTGNTMIYRPICKNGAHIKVAGVANREIHRGNREDYEKNIIAKFQKAVIFNHRLLIDSVETARNQKFEEDEDSKEKIVQLLSKRITKDLAFKALDYAKQEFGELSRWSIANGVSFVSQTRRVSAQVSMDTLAGRIITGEVI